MLKNILSRVNEIARLPVASIELQSNSQGRDLYEYFNKRHAKYRIIRNKTVGVALLRTPESIDTYMRGKSKQVVRTNLNKARKQEFFCATFNALDRVDEILEINRSADNRQGRAMSSVYTDKKSLREYFYKNEKLLGVFSKDNQLVGYVQPVISGELVLIKRILGHDAYLEHGIMYLLMRNLLEYVINSQGAKKSWIMYDTMLGAAPGLRYFKERLGFQAYRVKWRLVNEKHAS